MSVHHTFVCPQGQTFLTQVALPDSFVEKCLLFKILCQGIPKQNLIDLSH